MNYAWIASAICSDVDNMLALGYAPRATRYDLDHPYFAAQEKNDAGEPLTTGDFPELLYFKDVMPHPERKFKSGMQGFFPVVSGQVAGVMDQFDLGQGGLYPVSLANWNGSEIFDLEYYIVNPGNLKSGLDVENSIAIEKSKYSDRYRHTGFKDDEVALHSSVNIAPDMWCDSRLRGEIFFSAALGDAINDLGLKDFPLLRVRITD